MSVISAESPRPLRLQLNSREGRAGVMVPLKTQISGAAFLASRHRAVLGDIPRAGKTLPAIMAADKLGARAITVVTTASGRSVWRRAFAGWTNVRRSIRIVGVDNDFAAADVQIMSHGGAVGYVRNRANDLVIIDEFHRAKNPEMKAPQAIFGVPFDNGEQMLADQAVIGPTERAWYLSGTPAPHDPGDFWCVMRNGCPERLLANPARGWPNVTRYDVFRERYCVIVQKKISAWARIPVVVGGRNLDELRERIGDFILRRLEAEIGIRPPSYEMLPLIVSAANRRKCDGDLKQSKIMEAIDKGETDKLEMALGPLRRITGNITAAAVVEAVKDEFAGGMDKIVLMYWHREVGDILQAGLSHLGFVRLDGESSPKEREAAENVFRDNPKVGVFAGQIQASCEAIDLSAAAVLWFVETSPTPAHMKQGALRITNVGQKRNTFVKVCVIEGSIHEKIQESLLRLWVAINTVFG